MPDTSLTDIQEQIKQRLKADSYFADITVLSDRDTDIAISIQKALGVITEASGKYGVCCIVEEPVASDEFPDAPFGPLRVSLAVRVLENVVINTSAVGTGKAVHTIARRVHRVLKHFAAAGYCESLNPDKPSLAPIDDPLAPVAYRVAFWTQESDPDSHDKSPGVTIADNGQGDITLTATGAGSIYYTLDGSYPRSGQGTLYSGTFAAASGEVVRAASYTSGKVPSDVSRYVVP